MDSYFERLKKGMSAPTDTSADTEEPVPTEDDNPSDTANEEVVEPAAVAIKQAILKQPPRRKQTAVAKVTAPRKKRAVRAATAQRPSVPDPESIMITENHDPTPQTKIVSSGSTLSAEGELTLDMYQLGTELVVQSAVAGVKPEDLDIAIEKDIISIRGTRYRPIETSPENFFHEECYWGTFSRKLLVPVTIDVARAKASLQEGVLTIRAPIVDSEGTKKIVVEG